MTDQEPKQQPLRRAEAAKYLTDNGYPISPTWLAQLQCRGEGPEMRYFGKYSVYQPEDLLPWARSRLSKTRKGDAKRDADVA
jgi:hypothetical protein